MLPFDVILFDVGGVLLTNGWDHRERAAVAEQFHLDLAALEAHHAAPNDAWERDAISADDYMNAAVFYEPRSFSRQNFLDAVCAQSLLLPDGALGILKVVVASHRFRVGALNNEARETNEYRFDRFGLRAYFEFAFSSCYLGLRKPAPPIYRRAIDILGIAPDRILFIDDRAENAAGAASVGMKTVIFTGADALRRDLQSLGVL